MSGIRIPDAYEPVMSSLPVNVLQKFKPFVVGDLHISDKHSGRHVDYFRDCMEVCQMITEEMVKNNVTHLFLTGDLVGRTTEKNLQSREALLYFMTVLQKWNDLTDGNVYSVRGNHDFSEHLTDFEFFVSNRLIKVVDKELGGFIDVGGVRFHLVDYGDYKRNIEISEDHYNVAIMHTTLLVEGSTTWFHAGSDGVQLSSLDNLYGVDLVIGGHIHNPSVRMVETSIKDKTISLFYPGNPTRPRYEPDIWDRCYGVLFDTDSDGKDVDLGQIEFKLRPSSEIFQRTTDDAKELIEEMEEKPAFDMDQLNAILNQIKDYNLAGELDYKAQIQALGSLDEPAVSLALQYIEIVESELK